MSNFDIDFPPWINYGNANKEVSAQMDDLTYREWSPFNGQKFANVFIFCMAYGFAKGKKPEKPPGSGSMPGSAFDAEMRDVMKIVAISEKKDLEVAIQAKETVKICEGYAYAAFPEVYDKIANCDSSIPAQTRIETLIQGIQS